MHVATSDFGQMGNPFSARSYRLSHAASQELRGHGDVKEICCSSVQNNYIRNIITGTKPRYPTFLFE